MIFARFMPLCLFIALLAGCTSVDPVKPGSPSIEVSSEQTVRSKGATVNLPAGVYKPDFRSADGIYYRAPSAIPVHQFGIHNVSDGGLYVPDAEVNAPAHWMWMAAGVIPSHQYPFDPPVRFRYVRVDTQTARLPDAQPPTR